MYIVAGVYLTLAITGLLGNAWVLFTVLGQLFACLGSRNSAEDRRRRLVMPMVQNSACIYLLVLSVVDLISFVPVPFLVMDVFHNKWPYNALLCKLNYTCEGINKSLSPWILTALSVDRFIAVCKPTFVYMRQTRFSIYVLLVCILFSSLFIAPVTIQSEVDYMPDFDGNLHLKCSLEMPKIYDVLHVVFCYITPLFIICSVYIAILHRLYRHTRRTSVVGYRTSINLSRVVKCSVLVVAFYFICW